MKLVSSCDASSVSRHRISMVAATLLLAACAQEGDRPGDEPDIARQQEAITQDQGERHLRVLVRYEAGQFSTERASWVDGPVKRPRSDRPRPGLRFAAHAPGSPPVFGTVPDPRTVHVEVPGASGELEYHEGPAPGPRYFFIHVPGRSESVDFQPPVMGHHAAMAPGPAAAPSVLGSIDLRNHK